MTIFLYNRFGINNYDRKKLLQSKHYTQQSIDSGIEKREDLRRRDFDFIENENFGGW